MTLGDGQLMHQHGVIDTAGVTPRAELFLQRGLA